MQRAIEERQFKVDLRDYSENHIYASTHLVWRVGARWVFRQSWGPGWALIGDAGYFTDPLTAHGMTDAIIDCEILARATAEGTERALADYQRARDARAMGFSLNSGAPPGGRGRRA